MELRQLAGHSSAFLKKNATSVIWKIFRFFLLIGISYIFLFPVLLTLPGLMGVRGLQLCQPAADICTFIAAMVIVLGVLKELREKNEKMQVSEKKL